MSLLQDRPPDRTLPVQTGTVEAPDRSPGRPAVRRPRPVREILLIAALWTAYSIGRLAADGHVPEAFANAHRVWSLERFLHLPDEATIQHALFHSELLARTANTYYATVHFPATAAFLLWLYLRRPTHYLWARRALATLTATALVVHLLLPLAPPRMLAGSGLIDTAQRYGPSVYGSPATDSVTNQYAAMPSLHVGWSLMVAIGLIVATRSRWRWLWLAHPAVTLLVVVGTANHYWLDGIVAGALLTAVLLILPTPAPSQPQFWPAGRRVVALRRLKKLVVAIRRTMAAPASGAGEVALQGRADPGDHLVLRHFRDRAQPQHVPAECQAEHLGGDQSGAGRGLRGGRADRRRQGGDLADEDVAHAIAGGLVGDGGAQQRHEGAVRLPSVQEVADQGLAVLGRGQPSQVG
jgi:hypothetical protein